MEIIKTCIASSLLASHLSAFAGQEIDPINDDVTMVLTPARLRQSLADVPGSVTVISADMITKFGIRSVPEALRLVPGMAVTQVSGSDYRISYHGTNISAPRRMNVIIDGMSVYGAALAQVDWTDLPVAIEDTQRIEVMRSPDSTSYGPNSMLATINIITKHPKETDGTTLSATGGSRGTANGMARYGGQIGDATNYRITLEHQQNDGFNSVPIAPIGTPTANANHDASHGDKVTFRSITDIANNQSLDVQIALVKGKQDSQIDSSTQASYPDINLHQYDVNVLWRNAISENHDIQVQSYVSDHVQNQVWTECLPELALLPQMGALWRANPNYVNAIIGSVMPSGGTATDNALAYSAINAIYSLGASAMMPTCGNANQNYREQRADIEVQDTYVFSNSFRLVSGLGVRRDIANSQTYLDGSVGDDTWRVFANAEYKPVQNININIGGYFEKDQITGSSFSPRGALNLHIDENNTVRFVLSKADRMPDIFEQKANWSYLVTNLSSPVNGLTQGAYAQSASAPGNLQAEQIISHEIGYNGNFPQYGLMVDAKIFDDQLSNLISERLLLNSFVPTNSNSAKLSGAEVQIDYTPMLSWMMHAGYSFLQNTTTDLMEKSLYSKNSGSIALSHTLNNGWNTSVALYANEGAPQGLGQSAYSKQDVTLSKSYHLSKSSTITPTFTVTHLDNKSMSYMYGNGLFAQNSFSSPMQYYVTVKLTY